MVMSLQGRRARAADMKRTASIARALGLTRAGLESLAMAYCSKDGRVYGGNGALKLVAQGLADMLPVTFPNHGRPFAIDRPFINAAGRAMVDKARAAGW